MNWTRGFFRLWLLCSALFVFVTTYHGYSEVRGIRAISELGELMIPLRCKNASGQAGADYVIGATPTASPGKHAPAPDDVCWVSITKYRELHPEQASLSDDDVAEATYRLAGQPLPSISAETKTVLTHLAVGLGVPLSVLAVGFAVCWVLAGFRSASSSS